MSNRKHGKIGRKFWFTEQEDQFLRDHYLVFPSSTISRMLGRAKVAAKQRMEKLGLIVPEYLKEEFRKASHYQKGNVPHSAGRKMTEWASPAAIKRMKKTMYKKGHLPHNTKHDQCITIRTDNRGIKSKFIRIALGKWEPLSRHLWKKHRGPIPKDSIVYHKNGNAMDCRLWNLGLMTRQQNQVRNLYWNIYPKDIAYNIRLRGVITRKINDYAKRNG